MTTNLEIRRGDLKPDLIIDLEDDGAPIPVSTASSVTVVASKNGAFLFKRAVDFSVDGQVTYQWQAGDTSTPGTLKVEVEIIWPGAKPQTIRPFNVVTVLPDLG